MGRKRQGWWAWAAGRTGLVMGLAWFLAFMGPTQAAVHSGKALAVIHSPDDRPCVFFRLTGVAEADPVAPGIEWFALPKTHPGYKEILALLLTARATGQPLGHVTTTGTLTCGTHVSVLSVSL